MIARHALGIGALVVVLAAGMLLPFLPGSYDRLAAPISLAVQLVGVVGLLFVPLGALWLAYELGRQRKIARDQPPTERRHLFRFAAIAVGCCAR